MCSSQPSFTLWELDKMKDFIAAELEQYEQIGTLAIKEHEDMGLWAKFAQKVLRAYSIATRIDTHCPECGRQKAFTVEEVSKGGCPKWWAIFDAEAEQDCVRVADALNPTPATRAGQ